MRGEWNVRDKQSFRAVAHEEESVAVEPRENGIGTQRGIFVCV